MGIELFCAAPLGGGDEDDESVAMKGRTRGIQAEFDLELRATEAAQR